jgi:hypothetical protein
LKSACSKVARFAAAVLAEAIKPALSSNESVRQARDDLPHILSIRLNAPAAVEVYIVSAEQVGPT